MKTKDQVTRPRLPGRTTIIERARALFVHDGELEIDDDAQVSGESPEGAYIQAWVWVPFVDGDLETEPYDAIMAGFTGPR